jgi:hypothetical protein
MSNKLDQAIHPRIDEQATYEIVATNHLELLTTAVHRRQLATPLLLMLAGHRPLTFITGQCLYMLAPVCGLLGWQGINDWAALFSAPDANQRLITLLATPPAE